MTYTNYTKAQIAAVCLRYGKILQQYLDRVNATNGQGEKLDGPTLMFAIAGNESEFGVNCKPRHEPAYDTGGKYFRPDLFDAYGRDCAYSYGPFQLMFCNAPGFTPEELSDDLEKAALATIGYVQRYVLAHEKAVTLAEILDTYNSGNWRDRVTADVQAYIDKGTRYYFQEVIADADPASSAATA